MESPPDRSGELRDRLSAWGASVRTYLGFRDLRPIWWILAVGLTARLILLPLSDHPFDVYQWYLTGNHIYSGQGLYPMAGPTFDYPPVFAGFIAVTDGVYRVLAPALGVSPMPSSVAGSLLHTRNPLGAPIVLPWLFVTLVKLPLVAFDLLLTVLLYRVVAVRFARPTVAPLAAGLFFLNPAVVVISSVWGQFDVIAAYLLLLGLLLFLDHHPVYAGAILGLATATKYFPAIVVLAFVIVYYRRSERSLYRPAVAAFLATLLVVSLPFVLSDFSGFLLGVQSPTTPRPQSMDSIWVLFSYFPSFHEAWWTIDVSLVAVFALLAMTAWYFRRLWSRALADTLWLDVAVVALLSFFLVYRTINDQYFVWIMPFLVVDIVRGRVSPWVFATLSVLVTAHAFLTLAGTSFFLPSLTISPGFAKLIFIVPYDYLNLTNVVGVAVWAVVAGLFTHRILWLRRELRRRGEVVSPAANPQPPTPGRSASAESREARQPRPDAS